MKTQQKGCSELPAPSVASTIDGENTLTGSNSQVGSSALDGEDHPFYELQDMIEGAGCMVDTAQRATQRRSVISRLKLALNYTRRIQVLLPYFDRQVRLGGGKSGLVEVARDLKRASGLMEKAITRANDVTLQELKSVVAEASVSISGANDQRARVLVADEDAKFPACRNADGELVVVVRGEK